MRKILIITYFLIIVFTLNSKAQDFWELVNIPDSINPSKLAFNSFGDVFMGSSNGVYKSEDEGETWIHCGNLTKATYNIVVSSDDYIYAGTSNSLYRSTDNGFTWQFIDSGLVIISLNITSNDILYCGNWGGLYKSVDSGYTWTQVIYTVNMEVFNDIIEKDSFLFAGSTHFMSSTGGGVYRSSDSGDTWEHIALSGQGIESFAVKENGNLLAGSDFNYSGSAFGVFESEDGFQWDNILPDKLVTSIAVDLVGGIYAGFSNDFGGGGLWYSDDGGQSWICKTSGMHVSPHITRIKVSPSGYIYSTTYNPNYLYRSVYPIVCIDETELNKTLQVKVYPNPFNEELFIQINNMNNRENDIYIQFYNVSGIKITEIKIYNSIVASNKIKIDTDFIKPGMYLMKIIIGQKNYSIKILKK